MELHRSFGKTNLKFFPLGLGTIWFGRQWPPENAAYQSPSAHEIHAHLLCAYETMGNSDGVVMVDTAAAYGDGERVIGKFLRENPQFVPKTFLATKWGEDFDSDTGASSVNHSMANLRRSFERSLQCLGKIDLLYLHKSNISVLRDVSVINEMKSIKKSGEGGIQFLGASISDERVLEFSVGEDLLDPFDVVQMPAALFLKRPDLIDVLFKAGKAIVLNSPIRKSDRKDPKKCYVELLKRPEVSIILTGTRTHLTETVRYVSGD